MRVLIRWEGEAGLRCGLDNRIASDLSEQADVALVQISLHDWDSVANGTVVLLVWLST